MGKKRLNNWRWWLPIASTGLTIFTVHARRRNLSCVLCTATITVILLAVLAGTPGAQATNAIPGGPRLAFTVSTALTGSGYSLRTMSPDGPRPFVLIRGSTHGISPRPSSGVSWSPDGTWLYFAGRDGRRRGIYKLRADGTGLRFLRGTGERKDVTGGMNPVISPDGTKLAFTRDNFRRGFLPIGTSIWVGDSDGRGASPRKRWSLDTKVVPSSFTPDNSQLAVTLSAVRGNTNVSLLRLDRSRRVRLLAKQASEAAFSPDGSKIALVRHTMSSRGPRFTVDKDLFVINADGSANTPVTRTTRVAETHPSWDPLGQRIAFVSYRNGKDLLDSLFNELLPVNNSIAEVNASGTCRRKILQLNGAILRGVQWQPGLDRAPGQLAC